MNFFGKIEELKKVEMIKIARNSHMCSNTADQNLQKLDFMNTSSKKI
jgi:hypothetical protein